jgi:hypothetical protein
MSDSNIYLNFACHCGRPTCRGLVRPDDWRRPELRRKYRRSFSPYLLRRIGAESSTNRFAKPPHQRVAELHQDSGTLLD